MYPQEYVRRRRQGLAPPFIADFDPEAGEAAVLTAPASYERPGLVPSAPVSTPPVAYTRTRSRMVGEPADELTKLSETRDFHANQNVTNDDRWWKNLLKGLGRGALYGMGSGQGLAGAAGGALTGGLMGLAMPAMDDRYENQMEVAKLDDRYAQEYGRQKEALGLEGLRADVEYKRRRPDLEAEKIAGRQKEAAARNLIAVYNRLPEFDPDDPDNADLAEQMRAAGLPVVRKQANQQLRFVQDMRTGAWSVVSAPKTGGQATAAAVATPDGKPLATTSSAQISAEQQAANRASREKVAQWQISARKEIAAATNAVQQARVRMSADQFRQRYPGAGQVLTKDALIQKWQQLQKADPDIRLERVMRDAVGQGYTIQ